MIGAGGAPGAFECTAQLLGALRRGEVVVGAGQLAVGRSQSRHAPRSPARFSTHDAEGWDGPRVIA